jgi:hypothetical protein
MNTNKRKHTRIALNFQVALTFNDGKRYAGHTKDMSFGGAYISCTPLANTERLDTCTLELHLQRGEQSRAIPIKSRIVRSDAHGVGLQFMSIDINDYQEFKNIMVYNSSDAAMLLAELEVDPGLAVF